MRRGTCIHFKALRGTGSRCAKGVNYHDAFSNGRSSVFTTMPCVTQAERHAMKDGKLVVIMVPVNRAGETMVECALREFPSDGEVRFRDASNEARVQRACGSTGREAPTPSSRSAGVDIDAVHRQPARNWWDDKDDDA